MNRGNRCFHRLLVIALASAVAATASAAPPNDNCTSPTLISGTGVFPFNLAGATTSPQGQLCSAQYGYPNSQGIANDIWFCWTAPCTGLAEIKTCGLTTVDTVIAFYPGGCGACPTNHPLCCSDDEGGACGTQSGFTCETVCGQQYLIQIGTKPGAAPGAGNFSIQCNGQPCDCDSCCGRKPSFPNIPGALAVVTSEGVSNTNVVTVIGIKPQPAPGSGVNWAGATFFTPSGPQDWSKNNLGSVFGVTLDDTGNIYVAHSSAYGWGFFGADQLGALGGANAAGAIYKINSATGIPSFFANLPNAFITGCSGSECYPGLGNIHFSCAHKTFYVSNHEDGCIYALDTTGNVIASWRHSTGSVFGGLPPVDPNGFSPLTPQPNTNRGQRVWAVQQSRGRLYYSVWREDSGRPDPIYSNEIWSVALWPSGFFVAGSEQLELVMPGYQGGNFSNPVADISFTPTTCCMLLAERSMIDDTNSSAHSSRLLEYCKNPATGIWTPSGNTFIVGDISSGLNDSSAGGCDYDFATGVNTTVNVWGTADAIKFGNVPPPLEYVYGIGGLPFSGGDAKFGGIMIDIDQDTTSGDKFQQGDVEITCPGQVNPPPCEPNPDGFSCQNFCTAPDAQCAPVEVTLGLDGVYRITKCDCVTQAQCRLDFVQGAPPVCVNVCPTGAPCHLVARGNLDGTITFKCECEGVTAPDCGVISQCDPNNPGTCKPACSGNCPPGYACIPTEIRESPAGSGNFSITRCDCMPIVNPPCHPIVVNGVVKCIGNCGNGGSCRLIRTIEQPLPPPPQVASVRYTCECSCVHPPANMTDWWPMDDNPVVFPINDIAGLLNHGTPTGGVSPAGGLSCVGGGLFFNGSNGVVTVPNATGPADINFGLGNFTLEGWVQSDTVGTAFQPLLDKRTQNGGNVTGYAMYLSNGRLGFQIASNVWANFIATTLPLVNDGRCHHVAAVVRRGNPNTIKLFVDGLSQTFSDNTVLGSVNNQAALIFGRNYPIFVSAQYLFGVLDEWEFFRRALTDAEIIGLYNAQQYGKCREVCYVPPVVFCRNQASQAFCFQICNYTAVTATYNWTLSGPVGGTGCGPVGSMSFSPSAGTVTLAAGQCTSVCVTMTRPTGLPTPPPNLTGCYQLNVANALTGNAFACTNTIKATKLWCWHHDTNWHIEHALVGTERTFVMILTNEADPSGVLNYQIRAYQASDGSPDHQVLGLNGLPPGEPVIGTLSVPMGGSTQVPITVTVLENEPFSPMEIVLEADTDGDGEPDPLDVLAVDTVIPCLGEGVADVDGDGNVDGSDIQAFARALVGMPLDPYHLATSDTNCDGVANGLDIQPFVNALLSVP